MTVASSLCHCGDHVWRSLNAGHVALVSPQHAALLDMWNWHAKSDHGNYYAAWHSARKVGGEICELFMKLHRLVLPCCGSFVPDHKNGNGLDNRVSNLEPCNSLVNSHRQKKKRTATSAYRGVSAYHGRWRVTLQQNKRQVYVGVFDSETAAAVAYDEVATRIFGRQAMLNFPAGLPAAVRA